MSGYSVQSIPELVDSIGEDGIRTLISEFSCPINLEIETFVKNSSIDFANQKISVTHFLLDEDYHIVAIFTLAHKAIEIDVSKMSATSRKKVARYAEIDKNTGKYTVSAFLIAQFGKNMTNGISSDIPCGNEIMKCVMDTLKDVQRMVGSGIVYLECEDKPALLHFYQNESNKFQPFGARTSIQDNTSYIQLLRFF